MTVCQHPMTLKLSTHGFAGHGHDRDLVLPVFSANVQGKGMCRFGSNMESMIAQVIQNNKTILQKCMAAIQVALHWVVMYAT